jgi:hypothetical protein
MKFHTVYDSFESGPEGRDYIGKHSTESPYDEYKGSFKDKSFNPDSKIVFAYAKTKEGAVWLEIMFQKVFDVLEDPQYINRAYQTSLDFSYDRTGDKSTPEHCRKIAEALRGRKKSKENIQKRQETRGEYPRGENHPFYGETHNEDSIEKIKRARALQTNIPGKGVDWWEHEDGSLRRCETCPGEGWMLRKEKTRLKRKNTTREPNRRYVNEQGVIKRSRKHPGEGWQNGSKWVSPG